MEPKDRIVKAKINLLVNEPWFGQLSSYLELKERSGNQIPTAAINERGDFFFNPEFIKGLKDDEVKGLVCHEILHLAFRHLFRIQNRNIILWNIAADLKVNRELDNRSDIKLPPGGLRPDYSGTFKLGRVKIEHIDEKTTEQIYDELYSKAPRMSVSFGKNGKGMKVDTKGLPSPWKDLIEKMVKDLLKSKGQKGDEVKPKDIPSLAREWEERVNAANQISKGDIPAGIKRELAALEYPELPWHQIIQQRFSQLVKTSTWRRPNKRWLPYYFPGSEKNKTLKAVVAIDTSGSMSREDIAQAISETWGLANSFRAFTLYIIFNDADVWDVIEVKNGNQEKIKKLVPKGGGGTDFRPVFKLIRERWRETIDCLVFFTDGYGDFPKKRPNYQVYWVTQSDDIDWPFGRQIRLKSKRT